MKLFACLFLFASLAHAADSWIRPPDTQTLRSAQERDSISPNSVFEVPASVRDRAIELLDRKAIIAIREPETNSYTRGHFTCLYPESAYLVRAVYENEATGVFGVERFDGALWVSHSSLGKESGQHKTALVVCLKSMPKSLFVSVSGAM